MTQSVFSIPELNLPETNANKFQGCWTVYSLADEALMEFQCYTVMFMS
jgi:hypothetical protein